MLIDVGEPGPNVILNACFYFLVSGGIAAAIPWGRLGANRLSRLLRWLPVPGLVIAIVYEVAMPANYNIRVDLLILLPLYIVVIATSVFRFQAWKAQRSRE